MANRVFGAEPQESFRPMTQTLVAAIEILLDEIAALRGCENGPWVAALEQRVTANAVCLNRRGAEARRPTLFKSHSRP